MTNHISIFRECRHHYLHKRESTFITFLRFSAIMCSAYFQYYLSFKESLSTLAETKYTNKRENTFLSPWSILVPIKPRYYFNAHSTFKSEPFTIVTMVAMGDFDNATVKCCVCSARVMRFRLNRDFRKEMKPNCYNYITLVLSKLSSFRNLSTSPLLM